MRQEKTRLTQTMRRREGGKLELMGIFRKDGKNFREFLELLGKLKAVEFLGLARILGVRVEPNDEADAILEKAMDAFLALDRKRRRNFMRLLRQAAKKEES